MYALYFLTKEISNDSKTTHFTSIYYVLHPTWEIQKFQYFLRSQTWQDLLYSIETNYGAFETSSMQRVGHSLSLFWTPANPGT